MEKVEKMIKARNILLKTFVITYVILILSFVMYCIIPHFFYGMIHHFYGIQHAEASVLLAHAHILMKISAFVLFLMPALGLQWEIVCERKKVEKGE